MSSERIGKLERWILTHCKPKEGLTKKEVLFGYFNLEKSDFKRWYHDHGPYQFKVTKGYKAALVSYRRTTKSLAEKGHIKIKYVAWGSKREMLCDLEWGSYGTIYLTKKGRQKAQFLNVNNRKIL